MKKTKHILLTLTSMLTAAAVAGLGVAYAEEEKGHDHDHAEHAHAKEGAGHDDDHAGHAHAKKIAGPNGGRVITAVEPHLEFLVTKDRKVRITALDDDNKPAKIAEQTVKLTGGSRANPTRMTFEKDGDVLVSDIAFPAGNNLPVVLQIKTSADAKSVIAKFSLNLNDCPGCEYKEYACTCDHG
jgi:hypothetical protein